MYVSHWDSQLLHFRTHCHCHCVASHEPLVVEHLKLAYLHGVLEEEIYMEQPEGFVAQGDEDKVCRLMHSLYRLKQAGCVWNRTFAHTIKRKLGFNTIHSDVGVYVLHHQHKRGDSKTDMILILYVDDLLLLGETFPRLMS